MFVVNVFKTFIDKFFEDLKFSLETSENTGKIEEILREGIDSLNKLRSIQRDVGIPQVEKPKITFEELKERLQAQKDLGISPNATTDLDVAAEIVEALRSGSTNIKQVSKVYTYDDLDSDDEAWTTGIFGADMAEEGDFYIGDDDTGNLAPGGQRPVPPIPPDRQVLVNESSKLKPRDPGAEAAIMADEPEEDPFGIGFRDIKYEGEADTGPSAQEDSDRKMREKETIDRDAAQLLGDTFKNLYFSEIEEVINGFNKDSDTEKFNHILGMENTRSTPEHNNKILKEKFENSKKQYIKNYAAQLLKEIRNSIEDPNSRTGKIETDEAHRKFKNCKGDLDGQVKTLLPDINKYKEEEDMNERKKQEEKAQENIKQLFLDKCTSENRRIKKKINEKIDDYVNNLVTKHLESAKTELEDAAGAAAAQGLIEQFNRPPTPPTQGPEIPPPTPPTQGPEIPPPTPPTGTPDPPTGESTRPKNDDLRKKLEK